MGRVKWSHFASEKISQIKSTQRGAPDAESYANGGSNIVVPLPEEALK